MQPKQNSVSIGLTIISVIGWTLAIAQYSKINDLPPEWLKDDVETNRKLIVEHIKMDKCLK